ncbi:MAG TPA: hypothetical protein ENK23_00255 [Sorangium sp.]|nr:hypothetical protein [Sorangium sp.]
MRSGRLIYRGQAYRLVSRDELERGSYGAEVHCNGHEDMAALLRKLAQEPANVEMMRRIIPQLSLNQSNLAKTLSDALCLSVEGIAPLTLVRELVPLLPPCKITISGAKTLSSVSWGETNGIYPTAQNLYHPNKWDVTKLCQLQKARAAVHEVAKRNDRVHRSTRFRNLLERRLRPYHCTENFPPVDAEITPEVRWFYLSSLPHGPEQHPGLGQASTIAKSYGPFHAVGGGDAGKGKIYIHFYRTSSTH